MVKIIEKGKSIITLVIITTCLLLSCSKQPDTVTSVMDDVVTRLYATLDERELLSINDEFLKVL